MRSALVSSGLPAATASVVYPGVRSELFGEDRVRMPTTAATDGSRQDISAQGVLRGVAHGKQGCTHSELNP